jgi:hypothetical protein
VEAEAAVEDVVVLTIDVVVAQEARGAAEEQDTEIKRPMKAATCGNEFQLKADIWF